jgi:hypothetical protein
VQSFRLATVRSHLARNALPRIEKLVFTGLHRVHEKGMAGGYSKLSNIIQFQIFMLTLTVQPLRANFPTSEWTQCLINALTGQVE